MAADLSDKVVLKVVLAVDWFRSRTVSHAWASRSLVKQLPAGRACHTSRLLIAANNPI
jgi:hypothetical protein